MICYLFVGLKICLPSNNKPSIGGTAALFEHIAENQDIPIFIIIFKDKKRRSMPIGRYY